MELQTQPNEKRCNTMKQHHVFNISDCCPVSHNPREGSRITISYTPQETLLEVAALHGYIQSYRGGRGDVRSMEGMVQQITKDCAILLQVPVKVKAHLLIEPTQIVRLTCQQDEY